jgi:hypothetical protein
MLNEICNTKLNIDIEQGYNDYTFHRGIMTLNLDKFIVNDNLISISKSEYETLKALAQQFISDHPDEANMIIEALSNK